MKLIISTHITKGIFLIRFENISRIFLIGESFKKFLFWNIWFHFELRFEGKVKEEFGNKELGTEEIEKGISLTDARGKDDDKGREFKCDIGWWFFETDDFIFFLFLEFIFEMEEGDEVDKDCMEEIKEEEDEFDIEDVKVKDESLIDFWDKDNDGENESKDEECLSDLFDFSFIFFLLFLDWSDKERKLNKKKQAKKLLKCMKMK